MHIHGNASCHYYSHAVHMAKDSLPSCTYARDLTPFRICLYLVDCPSGLSDQAAFNLPPASHTADYRVLCSHSVHVGVVFHCSRPCPLLHLLQYLFLS